MRSTAPRLPKYAKFMERYQTFQAWCAEWRRQDPAVDFAKFCYLLSALQENPVGADLLADISALSHEIAGHEALFFRFASYVIQNFPPDWREPLYKLLTLDDRYFTSEDRICLDTVYLHKKGKLYTVEQLANIGATRGSFKPSVVYRDAEGQLWTRSITEFRQRFAFFLPR